MGTISDHAAPPYWSLSAETVLAELRSSRHGLSTSEVARRLKDSGPNSLRQDRSHSATAALARQFRSPLVLILIAAAAISAFVGEGHETLIISIIVLASCLLGFFQEYGASQATEKLKRRLSQKAVVLRNGAESTIRVEEVVPGDILHLSAGSLIPADGIILEARDLNVSEAVLTGETFPAVKIPGIAEAGAPLSRRSNVVFAGTSVRSGKACVLTVKTGIHTEFASIAESLERQVPETEFSRGIRRFGLLMTEIMFVMVILVFFANALIGRPLIDSILFSLALAVGLTPELLPAIISVTLARGARAMAGNGVIVRRLEAIESLGSMDILCTDKTGTLTEGVIRLDSCLDASGQRSDDVLLLARLNATLQSGLTNPLDEAILAAEETDARERSFVKRDEIPYDFVRKRMSVIVASPEGDIVLICKGAVDGVLGICSTIRDAGKEASLDPEKRDAVEGKFQSWSQQGFRVLGLATRRLATPGLYARTDENGLCFEGFLLFLDPPKQGIQRCLSELARRDITVKVISGDNRYVAAHLAAAIGLSSDRILTGADLSKLSSQALAAKAAHTDLFAEVDPNQKESIVRALRSRGHVVGYLGDGINDAPALHEADIGISVDSAVDVAREAADMVLLKRDLGVLVQGVDDGRTTFANTMKYISITTSANFGNMISMALASVALPFLPLLAQQVLLNNFLSDIPSFAIATDNVDEEDRRRPRHWEIGSVRRFMVTFGLVSSLFDLLTFGFLIFLVGAGERHFQTAWFAESLLTELLIVFIIRTRKRFWQSWPSRLLAALSALIISVTFALPFLPVARWFGFVPLPLPTMLGLVSISVMYLLSSELAKYWFFRREDQRRQRAGRNRRRSPRRLPPERA
ncbi:magnesium-translocating P-type ATPase [Rhizobium bangladeshense]|uniref:magnesium-translocating P-type ATPase n=1 Tax=Rhizobium bangladeshense TaxID=1138189 RepID=UPI001C837102|nr:magnesium-translocating P-type ATPase [Rhizobium bangladeshense]MBX4898892.1 magnesium-translocating P-type ATPase [Rhizobium bangladeshense]MBY3584171.1 magnesium-translocating P-type ATPase [Rhizobium bangladeshense]MBY3616988.1 magnesium-translocating P-type ATPase [Rhizobium bangladeshense]